MTLSQCILKLSQKYDRPLTERETDIATFSYYASDSEIRQDFEHIEKLRTKLYTIKAYSKFNPDVVQILYIIGTDSDSARSMAERKMNEDYPEHKWGIAWYQANGGKLHCCMHPEDQICCYCENYYDDGGILV